MRWMREHEGTVWKRMWRGTGQLRSRKAWRGCKQPVNAKKKKDGETERLVRWRGHAGRRETEADWSAVEGGTTGIFRKLRW